jgi:carboxyl-terminal processing protease
VESRSKEERIAGLKEADLSGHLSNGNGKKKDKKKEKVSKQPLASTDYPLYEALNLLKGMTMLNVRLMHQSP